MSNEEPRSTQHNRSLSGCSERGAAPKAHKAKAWDPSKPPGGKLHPKFKPSAVNQRAET